MVVIVPDALDAVNVVPRSLSEGLGVDVLLRANPAGKNQNLWSTYIHTLMRKVVMLVYKFN